MVRYLERRNATRPEERLCRIGISTGPVIGSLVGIQKHADDNFGPGVHLAARMERLPEPMNITIDEATCNLIGDDFIRIKRGEYEVKGFGVQPIYFLEHEHPHTL